VIESSTALGVVDVVTLVRVDVQTQVADVDVDEGVVELGVKGVDVALQTRRCRQAIVALMSKVSTEALELL
jgi:2-keto-3-deoxy-6-phosphogluconate aldolase